MKTRATYTIVCFDCLRPIVHSQRLKTKRCRACQDKKRRAEMAPRLKCIDCGKLLNLGARRHGNKRCFQCSKSARGPAISRSKMGHVVEEKTREKLRLANIGKPCDPGKMERMWIANRKRMCLPEVRAEYRARAITKNPMSYPGAIENYFKGLFRRNSGGLLDGPLFEKYIKAKVAQFKLRRSLNV